MNLTLAVAMNRAGLFYPLRSHAFEAFWWRVAAGRPTGSRRA